MNIAEYVYETINRKNHTRSDLIRFTLNNDSTLKELEHAFSHVFRSRRVNSTEEQAFCFIELYRAFRIKSQFPTYPDPKNGNIPKKIQDVGEFIDYNENSIYGFIPALKELWSRK